MRNRTDSEVSKLEVYQMIKVNTKSLEIVLKLFIGFFAPHKIPKSVGSYRFLA